MPGAPEPREIRLHYLAGGIDVELIVPMSAQSDPQLQAALAEAAEGLPWVRGLRVLYDPAPN